MVGSFNITRAINAKKEYIGEKILIYIFQRAERCVFNAGSLKTPLTRREKTRKYNKNELVNPNRALFVYYVVTLNTMSFLANLIF